MIKFILIAGIWVNTQFVTTLIPREKNTCKVSVALANTSYYGETTRFLLDRRPCEEIISEIKGE